MNKKRMILCSLASAGALGLTSLIVCLHDNKGASLEVLLAHLQNLLICIGVCLVATIPFSLIMYAVIYLLQNEKIKTSIHLLANRLIARQLTKNSEKIYPCLQSFLYETIKKNDILHIPVQDVSSVSFVGFSVKKDCVFYRFCINILDKPSYENDLLKTTLNRLLQNELNQYGIFGLSSIYKSIGYLCYSVYADKLFYDEDNHALIIDTLYVCTENSAEYYQNAIKRDNNKHNYLGGVYDDEL